MNNVYTFDPKAKEDEERKQSLLEVIDAVRDQIERGEIRELVACSLDKDGEAQIHVSALDLPGSVGLFEIGKHLLISQTNDVL
jgi:hypothetical protein